MKEVATNLLKALGLVLLLGIARPASAQYARKYMNLPEGSSLVYLIGNVTSSNTWLDTSIPGDDVSARATSATLVYEYIFSGFGGHTSGLGLAVPYANVLAYSDLSQAVVTNQSGVGDPALIWDQNIYGAKAMGREEFGRTPPETYGGLHLMFTLPWGQYNSANPVNLGSNRYSFTLTYNQSFTWERGLNWVDMYFTGSFYTANNEYLGNKILTQVPLAQLQVFYSRTILEATQTWLQAGVIWTGFGATYVDGVQQGANQNNWQIALGFGTNMWAGGVLIFTYSDTIHRVNATTPRAENFMVMLMQILGGAP
jgi:hypothetical protein